ncbi:MAG: LysM peptidoglycan-binding domain-containing protein [Cryobacterium sp.]
MSAAVLHLSMARISQNATPASALEPSHSTLRLTRRGRVVFTTLAAVPLVVGALVLAMSGGMALAADGSTPGALPSADVVRVGNTVPVAPVAPHAAVADAGAVNFVTIRPGQSLWGVAQAVAPHDDPRDVIADIVALNCMTVDAVQPGQRLALPAGHSY